MTRINTNVSSLTAQSNLSRSNEQLQTALTRLSTGLRINSGADDPAGLIASEVLKSMINNTNQAISNSQSADQMINTADSALGQVSSLLKDIRGLVTQAANTANMSTDQIKANQTVVDSSLAAINRIAQTTAFQGKNLLDGTLGFVTTTPTVTGAAAVSNVSVQQANLSAGAMTINGTITTAATQGTLTETIAAAAAASSGSVALGAGNLVITATAGNEGTALDGVTVTIQQDAAITAGAATAVYNASAKTLAIKVSTAVGNTTNATIAAAVTAATTGKFLVTGALYANTDGNKSFATGGGSDGTGLSADTTFSLVGNKGSQVFSFKAGTSTNTMVAAIQLATSATGVDAVNTAGNLVLKSVDYGTAGTVDVNVITGGGGITTGHAAGVNVAGTINGYTASGNGTTMSVNAGTLVMSATVTGNATDTFSFAINSGGALFQLGPNVTSSQQIRIGIQSVDTGHLGGTAGWLYQLQAGNTADLSTNSSLAASIVDQAITQLTSLRGVLGAFQKTTVKTNIAALTNSVQALTNAQSSISDADFAAETANLTRAQILTQSGTKVLQIANKNPENVLALLQ